MRNRGGKAHLVMDNRYEEAEAAKAKGHTKPACQKRGKDIEIVEEVKEDAKIVNDDLVAVHESYEKLLCEERHRTNRVIVHVSALQNENESLKNEVRQVRIATNQNPNQRYHDLCKRRDIDGHVQDFLPEEQASQPQQNCDNRSSLEVRQLKAQLSSVTRDLLEKSVQLEHAEKKTQSLEQKCNRLLATKDWLEGKLTEKNRRASDSNTSKKLIALRRLNKSMASQLEAKNILIFQQTRMFDGANFSGDAQSNLSNDPMFFHFHMLVQSVKIMIEKETNVDIAQLQCEKKLQSEVLYLAAREQHIEFYDWPKWLRVQFTKAHVESVYGCSAAFASDQAEELYFAGELTDQEYFKIIEADFHAASLV